MGAILHPLLYLPVMMMLTHHHALYQLLGRFLGRIDKRLQHHIHPRLFQRSGIQQFPRKQGIVKRNNIHAVRYSYH